jgi:hypothetical protein
MIDQHRAAPEHWDKADWYDSCMLELRARVEELEAQYETQRLATLGWGKDVDKHSRWIDDHLKRIMALEQRPIPGTVELAAPTPKSAPMATDKELEGLFRGSVRTWREALRAAYDRGRQHGAAAAQPAPPAAPPPTDSLKDHGPFSHAVTDLNGKVYLVPVTPSHASHKLVTVDQSKPFRGGVYVPGEILQPPMSRTGALGWILDRLLGCRLPYYIPNPHPHAGKMLVFSEDGKSVEIFDPSDDSITKSVTGL